MQVATDGVVTQGLLKAGPRTVCWDVASYFGGPRYGHPQRCALSKHTLSSKV